MKPDPCTAQMAWHITPPPAPRRPPSSSNIVSSWASPRGRRGTAPVFDRATGRDSVLGRNYELDRWEARVIGVLGASDVKRRSREARGAGFLGLGIVKTRVPWSCGRALKPYCSTIPHHILYRYCRALILLRISCMDAMPSRLYRSPMRSPLTTMCAN